MNIFRLFNKPKRCIPIVIIGIEYASHRFAELLMEMNKSGSDYYQIVAFIDEEPWNNRNVIYGAGVYYQSDLISLIINKKVEILVSLEGEKVTILDSVIEEVNKKILNAEKIKQIFITQDLLNEFSDSMMIMKLYFKKLINNL